MKRKNKSRNRIGYQQLENRLLLAALANGQEVTGDILVGESESFDGELALRDLVLNETFVPTSGLEATLEAGNEFLSSITDGQSVVFPLVIAEPGPVNVYLGQVDDVGGGLSISIYDELGVRIAFDSFVFSSEEVSFEAQTDKSYFAVVEANEPLDFRIRLVSLTGTNELISDRDFVVGEGSRVGGGISGGVTLAYLNVEQPGEMKFLHTGTELIIYDTAGQTVSFNVDDGILTFSPSQVGQYLFVANGSSLGLRPFDVQFDNDRNLIDGLDHPIQNGQEIAATLPPSGIALVPLDIDFSDPGFGRLHATGVFNGVLIVPLVQIYDSVGTLVSDNREFSFGDTEFGTIAFLPRNDIGPLFAVISSPNTPGPIDYRLRALRDGPSILIPGRDAVLENGIPFTSTVPVRQIAQFPVELSSPGSVSVDIGITQSDSAIQNGATVGFFARVPDLTTKFVFIVGTSDATFDFDVTEAGTYTILIEQSAFNSSFVFDPLPAFDDQQIEITVNGISQVSLAVTSFERDGRLGTREEVLGQPEVVDQLTFRFNQDVAVQADDLVLRNDTTGGQLVDVSGASFSYDPTTLTAIWDLSTLPTPLPAGFYSATFAAEAVASVVSGDGLAEDFSSRFHVAIPGDANLDGRVDVLGDAFALVSNLGTSQGAFWADGDFNGDGAVDVLNDAFLLVANLGTSITPTEIVAFQRDDQLTEDIQLLDRPDEIETLSVDFSTNVDVESDDLVLFNQTTNTPVILDGVTFSYDASSFRGTWDLSALTTPLSAGHYSASFLAGSISNSDTGSLLQDYADQFYVALVGDANLDGTVNVLDDAFELVGNLGLTEDARWANGDFNGNGIVNVLDDAFALIGNLGESV